MSWVRDRRPGDKRPIRVTFQVYPDRDQDLYEVLCSLRHGEISKFVRNAIKATLGANSDMGRAAVDGATARIESEAPGTSVGAEDKSSGAVPSSPVGATLIESVPPSASRPVASVPDDEDVARLLSLNKMFL